MKIRFGILGNRIYSLTDQEIDPKNILEISIGYQSTAW